MTAVPVIILPQYISASRSVKAWEQVSYRRGSFVLVVLFNGALVDEHVLETVNWNGELSFFSLRVVESFP